MASYYNDLLGGSSNTYKEFKYFCSYTVPIEIQCEISHLQLPVSEKVGSCDVPEEFFIKSNIYSNQISINEASMSTQLSTIDSYRNNLNWNKILTFPTKVRDLSWNAMMTFEVWSATKKLFGSTCIRLFDEKGQLRYGKQKLLIHRDKYPDTRLDSSTDGESYDSCYRVNDKCFELEKKIERLQEIIENKSKINDFNSAGWLNDLTLHSLQEELDTLEHIFSPYSSHEMSTAYLSASPKQLEVLDACFLVIRLPPQPYPILYEERPYHAHTNFIRISADNNEDWFATGCARKGPSGIIEFDIENQPKLGQMLAGITDWEIGRNNPAEDLYRKLEPNALRSGVADADLKPETAEKELLDKIIQAPGEYLANDERDLLYRFRFALTENKRALTKFLLSVDWDAEKEVAEIPQLISLWRAKAPMDEVSDALRLLGRGRAFQSRIVRQFAVDVLRKASDVELQSLLLQLVQALRYEPELSGLVSSPDGLLGLNASTSKGVEGQELKPIQDSKRKADDQDYLSKPSETPPKLHSPLATFLIQRAICSQAVGTSFYWYLKVQLEDNSTKHLYQYVFDSFMTSLSNNDRAGQNAADELRALDEYMSDIAQCQRDAKNDKGRKDQKEALIRELLSQEKFKTLPRNFSSLPLPLQPQLRLVGLEARSTFLFKSAMYPAVVEFYVKPSDSIANHTSQSSNGSSNDDSESSRSNHDSVKTPSYRVLFKSGDDLRQDQLVMQMIALMDSLLKRVNLDLKVLTYSVLATGQRDGIMEFVSDSSPISAVLSQHSSILNFLRLHNPDKTSSSGIKPRTMETFVRSCAGYCVMTYILGIGDRHLDNIMLTKQGQLFHIDFGYILGNDPKPYPPPFRLTRQMVDVMGGEDGEPFKKFKSLCCQAFIWLRKSANLIINLLKLMCDAGIPDLSDDSSTVLGKLEEKFRIDLSDEQAEPFFLDLINESLTALAPRLMEFAHQLAVARR